MNDLIRTTTQEAQSSSRMVGTVLFALMFVCSACLIAAGVILSAKAGM